MANRHRGEITAELGGRRLTLCLTLGALAELEDAFGVDDLDALANRLGSGRLSARDLVRILGAAARGGGNALSDEEIAGLPPEGGLAGTVALTVRLLAATFGEAVGKADGREAGLRPAHDTDQLQNGDASDPS